MQIRLHNGHLPENLKENLHEFYHIHLAGAKLRENEAHDDGELDMQVGENPEAARIPLGGRRYLSQGPTANGCRMDR